MTALRLEAALTWLYAAGFGGATLPVAVFLLWRGRLPSFFGLFDLYDGPWRTRVGDGTFVWLLVGFLLTTAAAAWAAWLVWNGSKVGGVRTLLLLPAEAVFWFGFDLPIAKAIGVARIVLLAIGWSSLS
ncbi:MAG: hypothetical protein U0V56_08270 [Actinomycetota bacterium]